MKKHFTSILSLILLFALMAPLYAYGQDAPQEEKPINNDLYLEILPGQSMADVRAKYENNSSYEVTDKEISGQHIFTIIAKEEKDHFQFFGNKADRLGISYDPTKGKVLYVNANIFPGDMSGEELTSLQTNILEQLDSAATLNTSNVNTLQEIYHYDIEINGKQYDLQFTTKYADPEGLVEASRTNMIAFKLSK